MSKIPGEHVLVALTFKPSANSAEKDNSFAYAPEKLNDLVCETPGFQCYRILTDEDNPLDYIPGFPDVEFGPLCLTFEVDEDLSKRLFEYTNSNSLDARLLHKRVFNEALRDFLSVHAPVHYPVTSAELG